MNLFVADDYPAADSQAGIFELRYLGPAAIVQIDVEPIGVMLIALVAVIALDLVADDAARDGAGNGGDGPAVT